MEDRLLIFLYMLTLIVILYMMIIFFSCKNHLRNIFRTKMESMQKKTNMNKYSILHFTKYVRGSQKAGGQYGSFFLFVEV